MENLLSERLRLTESDPLVLHVSAISDFLWPEFIREAKPLVQYLVDRFDIRQLSRFGKEVFEFLYCGGSVKPIVSFEAIEEYFRARQNGEPVSNPKGYKPENALWNQILTDISEHHQYPILRDMCIGDHFNSGNNAVCVLNELSKVVENMLETNYQAVDALTEKSDELSSIRSQFVQAMAEGNTQKAAELRQKGKELGQEIEQALTDAHAQVKPQISESIDEAVQQAQDLQDAMSTLAGDHEGVGVKLNNTEAKQKLARQLQSNAKLMQFAQRLGAFKRAFNERKRARKTQGTYSDIVGATMSNDVTRAFPTEMALAGTEEGKLLFALKHAERTLLTKDYEIKTKDLTKGDVVMYVDISGSMAGDSEVWSKAMAYVIVEECMRTNRNAAVNLFDSSVVKSITLKPNDADNADLLEFIMQWFTRGGTSFDQVMKHAYGSSDIDPKADILIITDGECELHDRTVRKFNEWKDRKSIDVHAFCIGKRSQHLNRFCDTVQCVDTAKDAKASDLFLSAID